MKPKLLSTLYATITALLYTLPPTLATPTAPTAAISTFPDAFTMLALSPPELLQRRKQNATESTADDLINGHCADVILIFARGTSNSGNIGSTLGRPLLEAMKARFTESVIGQGVPYPATYLGFIRGGSRTGINNMKALTMRAVEQCPDAVLVLAGFRFAVYHAVEGKFADGGGCSQGAQVLRKTLALLPEGVDSRVAAALLVADSRFADVIPGPFARKVVTVCKPGDWVCDGRFGIWSGTHFAYIYLPLLDWIVEVLQERVCEARGG